MILAAIIPPVKLVCQDIIKMGRKNVPFVQVSSRTALNATPKSANNVKIVPYLLELQENANPAILIITIAPHAEQPQIALPASPISTSLVEFANYVARIYQDVSHAKLHQQKPTVLAVYSHTIWPRIKLVSPAPRSTLAVMPALKTTAINA